MRVAYTREAPSARETEEMLLDCRIEGVESVTVPAGTYRTFHVICNNQRSGSRSFESWYVQK